MEFDPQTQNLKKILTLVRENNEILRDMESRHRRGVIFKALKWLIIAGLLFAAYVYYVQPFVEKFMDQVEVYSKAGTDALETVDKVKKATQ